ncbi:hypothetical protein LP421_06860 [Rhizobium sp. RCAM05350]|nr:hypothetical protein LP421_06860 [Rhizobium sp. RCAM05350]
MQGIADLTAIVAASDLPNVEDAARNHFKTNGLPLAVATKAGLIDPDGKIIQKDILAMKNGIVTIVKGRYVPDPALATGQRFIPNATPADAAQVSIEKEGTLHLAAMFSAPPTMSAVGTAASTKLAAFSIGSRLASLNGGILNQLLGQMLGTTISLKVMDYQALVDADIDIQPFLKSVSTRLNLTAASYDDVLKANLTMPQLLASMQAVHGISSTATSALKALETATNLNKKTFTLSQILNIDPKKGLKVDAGSNWTMKVSALDIVSAAAACKRYQPDIAGCSGRPSRHCVGQRHACHRRTAGRNTSAQVRRPRLRCSHRTDAACHRSQYRWVGAACRFADQAADLHRSRPRGRHARRHSLLWWLKHQCQRFHRYRSGRRGDRDRQSEPLRSVELQRRGES